MIFSKHKFILVFALTSALYASSNALAQVDAFQFDNVEQQSRFRQLSDELRCPMCQNTNLSGSTGGVAEDLRREIHRMIIEGMSNEEIEQFMFERYGDFIFYRPRLRAETILLWFGPIIFLVIGGFIAVGVFRRAKSVDETGLKLNDEQVTKLNELVGK
jgi:cytochrome c-type biogenesis protein CcmH